MGNDNISPAGNTPAPAGDASADGAPPSFKNATEKAIDEVKQRHIDSVKAFNEADTDDPMSNLNVLQAQLKLTEAINFATNLMMTIHQQVMAIINKLGEAGR